MESSYSSGSGKLLEEFISSLHSGIENKSESAKLQNEENHDYKHSELSIREKQLKSIENDLIEAQKKFEENKKEAQQEIKKKVKLLKKLRTTAASKQRELTDQNQILQKHEEEMSELQDRALQIEKRVTQKLIEIDRKEPQGTEIKSFAEQGNQTTRLGSLKSDYKFKLSTLHELQKIEETKRKEIAEEEEQIKFTTKAIKSLEEKLKFLQNSQKNNLIPINSNIVNHTEYNIDLETEEYKNSNDVTRESAELQSARDELERIRHESHDIEQHVIELNSQIIKQTAELNEEKQKYNEYEAKPNFITDNPLHVKVENARNDLLMLEEFNAETRKNLMKDDDEHIKEEKERKKLQKMHKINKRFKERMEKLNIDLEHINNEINQIEDEEEKSKQLLKNDKIEAMQCIIEEQQLEKKRDELEKQINELESEEQRLEIEELEMYEKYGIKINNVNTNKVMNSCKRTMKELRDIRKKKIEEQNMELLRIIEENEDELMKIQKNLFEKKN
ncbi:hypothetical protein GPJ56_009385 [Histomonas meleagridis]|uniref:uncharacterized protein n=1 Tax=Histomonas meleagridis TaxID=135588 RepID=UPI0035598416|nr:hypothetical protein GPJ56_009385 [Histomonas meleagridis]KAH0797511.1 hypothetical protein GO595_009832 [Histomonas meleagridis]